MRIVVCVKQVPASNEQRLDPVTGTVIREGVFSILNPFDAYAVEEALRLKVRFGGKVLAISMGVPSTIQMLKRTIALGVDEAYLLTDRAFAGADTLATACALEAAILKLGGADLVLCGKMATDGDTAQVGPMLAERLGIPHITDVSNIESLEEGSLELTRMTDFGYQRAHVPIPALVTVVKEINVPRLPSVAGVLRGRAADVRVLSATDINANPDAIGVRGSKTRVVKTQRPASKNDCEWLSNASDLVKRLREQNISV